MTPNKIKILTWAVLLLLTLNLATIGTIIYHVYQEKKNVINSMNTNHYGKRGKMNGRFFRDELHLTNTQMNEFHSINMPFRNKTHAIINDMDSIKNEVFIELQKSNPDNNKIKKLSQQSGILYSNLNDETAQFYLNIKKISNDEQQKKLAQIFYPFLGKSIDTLSYKQKY